MGLRPQIPILSVLCPQLNLFNRSRKKILGTPLDWTLLHTEDVGSTFLLNVSNVLPHHAEPQGRTFQCLYLCPRITSDFFPLFLVLLFLSPSFSFVFLPFFPHFFVYVFLDIPLTFHLTFLPENCSSRNDSTRLPSYQLNIHKTLYVL